MYDNIGIYCRQYNGEELGVFNGTSLIYNNTNIVNETKLIGDFKISSNLEQILMKS